LKFSIDKNIIQNLLIEHHKVVPIRTTLPILSTAFFCIEKNTLTIKTTDLEQTITSETTIEDEQKGSACIPMGKLHEIVSAMPEDKISFSVNEDFLVELNNKQGAYKITGRSPEEFPEDSKLETAEKIKLKGDILYNIIEATAYATSKDDLKPALSGVYFNFKKDGIISVATDGHRLVKNTVKEKTNTDQSLIIPVKFLNIIKNIINKKETISIDIKENSLSTKQKNLTIETRVIKESYPDFNSVIPENNTMCATAKTESLIACLKRVSIFSNRTTKQTILDFSEQGLVVSAQDPETSTSGKEHIDCDYKGEKITTSYNAKYLIDVLQHIKTENVNIYLSAPLSAATIQETEKKEKEETINLLMPLRLNN
tara:strand:+ start:169 stop:1278 length:1110 start_codon:yes stop_codon:yes gene_type:complete